MQKKHSFSPNHKVVTDSKHNHHPFGAPTTASQGQPPAQMGASGDGTQAPQDGGGMDGMNFCNGGMKYDDGGEILGGGLKGTLHDYGTAIKQTAHDLVNPNPVASKDPSDPKYVGSGGREQTDTNMSIADKAG